MRTVCRHRSKLSLVSTLVAALALALAGCAGTDVQLEGKVFDNGQSKPTAQQQRLESENTRLKSVIAEITAENLELKKGLWG